MQSARPDGRAFVFWGFGAWSGGGGLSAAGIREGRSKDGFLASGLALNNYGDHSNAIGKWFGRLKVFHLFPQIFMTLLENAGVHRECIVGHDQPLITYGLYFGEQFLKKSCVRQGCRSYPHSIA